MATNNQNKRKRGAATHVKIAEKAPTRTNPTRTNPTRTATTKTLIAPPDLSSEDESQPKRPKNSKKPRKNRANPSTKHFRFLELPGELRTNIYDLVLADSSVTLRRSARRRKKPTKRNDEDSPNWQDNIVVASPLTQVNKQICAEFFHAAAISADIRTTVVDFEFGHIITFLNRLTEGLLDKMKAGEEDKAPKRNFTITLQHLDKHVEDDKTLRRWLNRMEVPEKKGTNIDFRYICSPLPVRDLSWQIPSHLVALFGGALSIPSPTLPRRIIDGAPTYSEGGRGAEERAKIVGAADLAQGWK